MVLICIIPEQNLTSSQKQVQLLDNETKKANSSNKKIIKDHSLNFKKDKR